MLFMLSSDTYIILRPSPDCHSHINGLFPFLTFLSTCPFYLGVPSACSFTYPPSCVLFHLPTCVSLHFPKPPPSTFHLPTYLPACPLTYLPTHVHAFSPTYIPICTAHLRARCPSMPCSPTFLPTSSLPSCLPYLPTYPHVPFTSLPTSLLTLAPRQPASNASQL